MPLVPNHCKTVMALSKEVLKDWRDCAVVVVLVSKTEVMPIRYGSHEYIRKSHTLLFIVCHCFIMLSSQLGPLRKLVLRARRVHFALQTNHLPPKLNLRPCIR